MEGSSKGDSRCAMETYLSGWGKEVHNQLFWGIIYSYLGWLGQNMAIENAAK